MPASASKRDVLELATLRYIIKALVQILESKPSRWTGSYYRIEFFFYIWVKNNKKELTYVMDDGRIKTKE